MAKSNLKVKKQASTANLKVVDKNAKTIVDTEGLKLVNALKEGVFMVKPNLKELEDFSVASLITRSTNDVQQVVPQQVAPQQDAFQLNTGAPAPKKKKKGGLFGKK